MPIQLNSVEALTEPKLIKIRPNLFTASFECMKMLTAKYMLDRAVAEGRLDSGGTVVESSSGTLARGLATYAKVIGVHCIIVSADSMDHWLQRILRDLGAELILVKAKGAAGIQAERLAMLRNIRKRHPGAFWTEQYSNPDNFTAYASLATRIVEELGAIDFLVGPCGTGGSTAGTASFLREVSTNLRLIGADLPGSVLFGQREQPRVIGGMSSSIMTSIPHAEYDLVSWVPESHAIFTMRKLFANHGLYHGGSSGAAFAVADWWAKLNPQQTGVVIFPDSGHRYAKTLYDHDWLNARKLLVESVPHSPKEIVHPHINQGDWTFLNWGRRELSKVIEP